MTLETIPQTADLRAELDQVYSQGPTQECLAWACKSAIEVYRNRAGLPFRSVSAHWIFDRAQQLLLECAGMVEYEPLARVMEIGFLYDDQYQRNAVDPSSLDTLAGINGRCRVTRQLPYPNNSKLAGIHRSIAMGMPVMICIPVGPSLWDGIQKPDWKTHDPVPPAYEVRTHWCTAVGYDLTLPHQPTLIEDSSGPDTWDGGFFGLPAAWVNSHALLFAWRIEAIEGIQFRPIGGFMAASPPIIPTFERSQMLTAQESIHVGAITALLAAQNVQGVIDYCRTHGVNDKWAASMFSLPATFMLDFKNANPGLNWDGFPWWPQ